MRTAARHGAAPMARLRATLLTVALAAAAVACSTPEEDTAFRDDLRTQAEANEALRERVGELDEQVSALREGIEEADAAGRLESVEAGIAELDQRLGDLAGRTGTQGDEIAELRTALGDLRQSLSALDDAVATLRRELRDLETRHNLLEQRFDNHQHHPPG
jgi:chromosome segregation ATPase